MSDRFLYAKDISEQAIKLLDMLDDLSPYQKAEVLVVAQQLVALEERREAAKAIK